MPCKFNFSRTQGNTVPYPPFRDRVRNNRGFVDLRGRPDEAVRIAEAQGSRELGKWLVELAAPHSKLISLGCDIGSFKRRDPVPHRHATGGYVQLLAGDFRSHEVESYKGLAERLSEPLREASGPEDWEASFLLQSVSLGLDGHDGLVTSLSVEFNAWARTPAVAATSRERMVRLLRQRCGSDQVFGRETV